MIDEQGCNPSCLDVLKYTPLHLAAAVGDVDIIRFLTVEKNCNPMCRDSSLDTPLHRAAIDGRIEAVKFLTVNTQ